MKKFLFFIFILFAISGSCKDALKTPKDPEAPDVQIKVSEEDKEENKETAVYNIEFQNQKGNFGKGTINEMKGFYLSLVWPGNENGQEEILIDFVKAVRIKGYTPVTNTKENLTGVYYFPHMFDIELKDGKIIKNAKGRIKELDSFIVFTSTGRVKCFTYFVRYWLEDKKMFSDNKSKDINETPKVPDAVIIYIEFKDIKK